MKKYLSIIFLFSTSIFFCQKVDSKAMIGFGCYSNGRQSETVEKFDELLEEKKYNDFIYFLSSENNAEKALATFICEKLNKLKKIELTLENLEQIEKIKNSDELVSVCSGCTYFEKIPIKNLFSKEEKFLLEDYGNFWIEQSVKN